MSDKRKTRLEQLLTPPRLSQLRAEERKVVNQLEKLIRENADSRIISKVARKANKIGLQAREKKERLLKAIVDLNDLKLLDLEDLDEIRESTVFQLKEYKNESEKNKLKKKLEEIDKERERKINLKRLEEFIEDQSKMFRTPPPHITKKKDDDKENTDDSETSTIIDPNEKRDPENIDEAIIPSDPIIPISSSATGITQTQPITSTAGETTFASAIQSKRV